MVNVLPSRSHLSFLARCWAEKTPHNRRKISTPSVGSDDSNAIDYSNTTIRDFYFCNTTTMSFEALDYTLQEQMIDEALTKLRTQSELNVKAVARDAGVPYSRPYARHLGRNSRMTRPQFHCTLSEAAGTALCMYLDRFDELERVQE